ncbi:MAG: ATP-binding protein [Microthrixaceae bacterium]
MKCIVCRGPAIIDIRRANSNFCPEHFTRFCESQTARAIADHGMLADGDRVLVAVSGGKDSLAVWDILVRLGYEVDGIYVGLGIGDYSESSWDFAHDFATERGLNLIKVDLETEYGYGIPEGSKAAKRTPCSACGTSKRHIFDKAARDGGYDVLVTGHNLDDEAAVLFGNVLRWQTRYLARQAPVLAARDGFPKKVKPLVRLGERETAAYCIVNGIDYVVEECPMAVGNRHIGFKEALNEIEARSPGTKGEFYNGFLKRMIPLFPDDGDFDVSDARILQPCARCGSPAEGDVCAFCRLVERATSGGRQDRTDAHPGISTPNERGGG